MRKEDSGCAIELRGVKKSFWANVALDDVSLNLESGHFYALLGRNGAGKSTLIKILMRYIAPDAGDGRILGIPLSENNASFNGLVGFASESINFALPYPMDEFFSNYRRIYQSWDQTLFEKIIGDLGLDLRKRYGALSRGQRMQVAMAVAISIRPKVLLLDEVTSVLDAGARSYFMNYLDQFTKAGSTVIMATNMVAEVHHVADWLIFLEASKLKLLATTTEVSARFQKLRRAHGRQHPVFGDDACEPIHVDENDSVSYLIPADRLHQYHMESDLLDPRKATAEEIFIYFTKGRME